MICRAASICKRPSQAQLVRFSRCMRANGIADFPDPSNGGMAFNRAAVI